MRLVSDVMPSRFHATVATARPYIVRCMKKVAAALVLTGLVSTAHAAEYAPQEFDFSGLGTVECVRQVPVLELLPNVFEHAVRPETVNELVIRVDDGREVILREGGMQPFVVGERVRLDPRSRGPRAEYE